MEMESAGHKKAGFCRRWWTCLKALPEKLTAKVTEAASKIKKIGKDDPRRVIHSLKVGIALTLVSLFYYSRTLYKGFGDSAMWAVMTVVVVLEFSVGKFTNITISLIHKDKFALRGEGTFLTYKIRKAK